MASSSPRLPALALFLGLLLIAGCAHAGAAGRPSAGAAGPPPAGAAGALDPSEEITPEELASIPEPVPGGARGAAPKPAAPQAVPDSAAPPAAAGKASGEALEPRSPSMGSVAPAGLPNAAPGGEWIWCVQILATPDRALAERTAKEAAARLGAAFRIDLESGLRKVRLGGFSSEAEAQVLRRRAAEMGYAGAFRVKVRNAATDE